MEDDAPKGSGQKLEWLYKPAALVDREEYLMGRTVDKSLKLLDELEKGNNPSEFNYLAEAEKDLTPLSIFASQGSGPIDIIKKIKDDPLYKIQKEEQERYKKLLQNPVKMKQLNQLVEARDSARSSSSHKKHKKKHKKHKNKKDDGAHSSSSKRKHRSRSSSSSSNGRDRLRDRLLAFSGTSSRDQIDRDRNTKSAHSSSRSKRKSSSDSESDSNAEKKRKELIERFKRKAQERRGDSGGGPSRSDSARNRRPSPPRQRERPKLDEEELERRRKEMMDNAKWRDQQRTKNVSKYREDEKKEEESLQVNRDPDFIRKQLLEAANTGSVEQRVKSNSYNIQRSKSSMNQNFLKR